MESCRIAGRGTERWIASVLLTGLLVGLSLPASGDPIPSFDRTRVLQQGKPITDFELTDHNNERFSRSQLDGRVAIVFFGFTNCKKVCPTAMQRMRQMEQSRVVDWDDVAFVLISVDGERDTPEVMKKFLAQFSPRFIGLTGSPQEVKKVAKQFATSFYKGTPINQLGDYDVAHSPQVYALDPGGNIRAEFYHAPIEAMNGVTLALLQEASKDAGGDQSETVSSLD